MITKGEKGELDWLVHPESGKVLKGSEAIQKLQDLRMKANEVMNLWDYIPMATKLEKGTTIENEVQLGNLARILLSKEKAMNEAFLVKAGMDFKLEDIFKRIQTIYLNQWM